MTYSELLNALQALSPAQLAADVTVYVPPTGASPDEAYSAYMAFSGSDDDVLDANTPIICLA